MGKFRTEIIHPLRRAGLISLDKKKQRYVKIRDGWKETVKGMFDQGRMDEVIEKVSEERREYYQRRLHGPVAELLGLVGQDHEIRSDERGQLVTGGKTRSNGSIR